MSCVYLISVYVTSVSAGCKIVFQNGCKIYSPTNGLLGYSKPPVAHGDLYPLIYEIISGNTKEIACPAVTQEDPMVLHKRYCHINAQAVQKRYPYLTDPDLLAIRGCKACKIAKQTRDP